MHLNVGWACAMAIESVFNSLAVGHEALDQEHKRWESVSWRIGTPPCFFSFLMNLEFFFVSS